MQVPLLDLQAHYNRIGSEVQRQVQEVAGVLDHAIQFWPQSHHSQFDLPRFPPLSFKAFYYWPNIFCRQWAYR